jgi:c-di-GMP-related signal transduction protein
VLTYRLLQVVNSPVFGAKREIDTIRQALMLLGQKNIRDWLQDQLPSACSDKDLLPVRQTMVLRARLMQYLMSAGPQVELRNEIYLTGLFSQLDQLLNEPLPNVLQRLPLPERLVQALLQNEGPYFAYLDLAVRLEHFERMDQIPEACRAHNFELDDVNRALIRMLAHWNNEI